MTGAGRWAAIAALLGALAGCGSDESDRSRATSGSAAPPAAGCTGESVPTPQQQTFAAEPPLTVSRTTYLARMITTCGTITLTLDAAKAPRTVNSFAFLAGKRFFDGSRCHRLTTAGIYVLQCGDPTGTGGGEPGYSLPEENLAGARYPAGTVAMANAGSPGSGGSQFFLVYQDSELAPQFTPFGRIAGGLDVLRRIAAAGTDESSGPGDGAPKANVVLRSVTVTRG